ncbi:kinase-like domain-containing protein, partial [Cunninghamella echinulata]
MMHSWKLPGTKKKEAKESVTTSSLSSLPIPPVISNTNKSNNNNNNNNNNSNSKNSSSSSNNNNISSNTINNKNTLNTNTLTATHSTSSSTSSSSTSSRSTTKQEPCNGVLLIRVCDAQGISIPPQVKLPNPPPTQPLLPQRHRESLTRKQHWWLPYVVLEFDKNEVLVDALAGDTQNPIYQYRAHFDVSRSSDMSISIYLKPPPGTVANDYYLGGVKLQPNFDSTRLDDQVLQISGGTGMMHIQLCYKPQKSQPIAFDSFDLLRVIGRGSFGKVYVVRKKDTNRIYAMKVLRKSKIISRSEVTHTMAEKTVLAKIQNPFIVPLKFAFQSPDKLYLVLAFVNGGELFHHLQNEGKFDENRSKFYTA